MQVLHFAAVELTGPAKRQRSEQRLPAPVPRIVPFAASNFRIGDDWKAPRWRVALYWTLGIGINPNTTSTDFVTAPSIFWRALMFSAF